MENPMFIALSSMMALREKMDTVANNVANTSTTAYKQQRSMFAEVLKKTTMSEQVSLVQNRTTVRDMSEGPIEVTTNPLDVALKGKGFFTVDTLNGPHYTRSGRFQLDAKGQMVDDNGLPVLDANTNNKKPVLIPNGTKDIRIAADGSVFSDMVPDAAVGRLSVVSFKKEAEMKEIGNGIFITDEKPDAIPAGTRVIQGSLEQSNVKPVQAITNMIDVLRQYQSLQKVMDAEHDRQKTMIQKLGRTA